MQPIYQLSQEEEKILVEYIEKIIREKKIRPLSSSVGSPIFYSPKANRNVHRLCVDYANLNNHTKKNKTGLPIIDISSRITRDCNHITKTDMKVTLHLMWMEMCNEMFTAFRTKFGLYKYMVKPLRLTNAQTTFQRDIDRILRPFLWLELVINTILAMEDDGGLVVVEYIYDILIATKQFIEKYHIQVCRVFQLLLDNDMWVEIGKSIVDAKEVWFLGCMVKRAG